MATSLDSSSSDPKPVSLHWQLRLALALAAALPAWALSTVAGWGLGQATLATLAAVAAALVLGEPLVRAVRRQEAGRVPEPADTQADADTLTVTASTSNKPPDAAAIPAPPAQMRVVYRPLLPIAPNLPAGVEVALRWQHLERGLLPVDPWLPDARPELDRLCAYTVDAACRQFMQWHMERGADAPAWMALSLPVAMLDGETLDAMLMDVLQGTGLSTDCVRLVVPARLSGRVPVLPASALGLRASGIGLLLDHFGSGPTSLAQLGQMPVDAVRIDRSFVERAAQGATQRMVIESTVRVAASLGMQIVADGIANQEQVLAMAALGCHYAQGSGCGLWKTAADLAGHALPAPPVDDSAG